MGRNQRKNRTLGFQTGECWGGILAQPPNSSPSAEASMHVFRNGGRGGRPMVVRSMVKFEEIERLPQRHAAAMARIERAKSYGCEIELVVDWFNKADRRSDYHRYVYMPTQKSVKEHIRDLVRLVRPDQLEVCNEFWHTRGSADMSMEDYSSLVYQFAEGCIMAGGQMPRLNASTRMDKPRDKAEDLWVWNIPYDDCCEVYHRFILDQEGDHPRNAEQLEYFLMQQAHFQDGRNKAIGWIWPLDCNETTFNGQHVDLNSQEGAAMVRVTLDHYRTHKYPAVFLAMGGSKPFEDGGEWELRVDFVDDRGNLSIGVEEWLRIVGGDPYEGPGDIPPTEPPDGGGGGGIRKIRKAKKALDRAVPDWGSDQSYADALLAKKRIDRAVELAGE